MTALELLSSFSFLIFLNSKKNQALNHANNATKIDEIHAEKAEFFLAKLTQLKALLDSKMETEACENQLVLKLKTDIESLKVELGKAKG